MPFIVIAGSAWARTMSLTNAKGLVAQREAAGLGDRLQARGEVRFGADDCLVHAVAAAEIADMQ